MLTSPPRHRQQGAALLLMMLVVLVAATTILITRLDLNTLRTGRLTDSQAALAHAREALIDYATIRADMAPGSPAMLPCPDINAGGGFLEGVTHTAACGATGVSVMGRLPWRTLGVTPLKDSSEACLWYVVSGSYKEAGAATPTLVNPDSNGQLQLLDIDSGAIIAGVQPDERPVAMIIAPMPALAGQVRPGPASAADQCSSSFAANRFLDTDSGSGVSNASLSGAADGLDVLATVAGYSPDHNDRIAIITRADLAEKVVERHDFDTTIRGLGLAVGECLADYARKNPGGPTDKRLPWPTSLSLADYRPDNAYDDLNTGALAGRLADIVDTSNVDTGNAVARILSDCDTAAVPTWTPQMAALWQNWKDHFFYAVAESFAPDATVPSACTTCLTVNGVGQYAAVLLFGNARLNALGQVRDAPPTDPDTRDTVSNYLEGANAANVPFTAGSVDFISQPATATFNDRLFCVDDALAVTEC